MATAPTRTSALLLAALATLAITSCASGPAPGPVRVTPGQRTTVRLVQFTTNQAFSLQNVSSGTAADVYSDAEGDRFAKVVTDAEMQALLDVLAAKGAFANPSATVPTGARDALIVQQGERRWLFARQRFGLQEAELPFHEAKACFLSVWNGATAYHSSKQAPDFPAESDRMRADSAAQREKARALDGRKQ